ncbi:hypothetical protein ACRAKI_32880 [Saccharothrix isguenensis]
MLNTHGIVVTPVTGATPADSLVNAITTTLGVDPAPVRQNLQHTPDPTPHQIAEAAGVRVHVLEPNGTFTSYGKITGIPVHVVRNATTPLFDATTEAVHIGRPGVAYPGPTTVVDKKGVKQTVHRGEFEVETIAGQHHVRVYTAVVNPATFDTSVPGKPSSPFKDIQQDPTSGALTIAPGSNAQLWAGGGRPQRAVQWLTKYHHSDGGKPVAPNNPELKRPVLRSFLVPLAVFNEITSESTVEGAPGTDSTTHTYNVDQRGEPNQFGIGGPHLDALVTHATPGSLVTYSSPEHSSFAHPDQAGRVAPIATLHERLGLDPDFKSDGLGKEYDPWFSWTQDGSGNWKAAFNNNPQKLRDIAIDLREHHVTWQQVKQDPADRKPDALIEPDAESAPRTSPDAPRDTSYAARHERLNQFLNSVGPPSANVAEITTGVLSTAPPVLTAELAARTVPPVTPDALRKVLNEQVVPKSLDAAMNDLAKTIKQASGGTLPLDKAAFTAAVKDGITAGKGANQRKKPWDENVTTNLVTAFVKDVTGQEGLGLLTDQSRNDVAADLGVRVDAALKAEFAALDSFPDLEGGRGRNASWLSGPRLAEFKQRVAQRLQDPPNVQAEIDPQRFADVAQQKVLGPVVDQALGAFTAKDLVNTSPADLKAVVRNEVLPALTTDIETSLREHPALDLVDPNLRDSIAHDVAVGATAQSEVALAGFAFTPVDPAEVDAFMAKVPGVAAQAAIGALIAADSDRIAIDFNTRPQGDGPFPNDYDLWSSQATATFEAQREAGDKLSTAIDTVPVVNGKPNPFPVVDQLIGQFPELGPKFDEVATKPQAEPYRAPKSKDGFTFHEHAQMVLGQYLDLTKAENPDTRFISTDAMAKAILFHDIEKNNAKNQFGDGKGRHDAEPEHKLAVQMMDRYQGLWSSRREFDAVRSIVDSDPIGFYLRGKISADEAFTFIHDLAERVGDPDPAHAGPPNPDNARKLFDEFHQYYQADFSSYTTHSKYTDANGDLKSGPNHFTNRFETGPDGIARTDDGRHFKYTGDSATKIDQLRAMFADPDTITANRDQIRQAEARNQTARLADPAHPGTPAPNTPNAPNAPTSRNTPGSPSAPPAKPSERATRGPSPELSLDIPPTSSPDPRHTARLDSLAADLAESNAMRDRNGYRPAVVEVSGPHAQTVADALAARGVDATVRDTNGATTDVHVDHDLRRPDAWTPPEAPRGTKVTDTLITSPEPRGPHPVLDDPGWRHSTAPSAPWFDANPNAASSADIREAARNAPVTSTVRGEDGGVLDSTTISRDGIGMRAWRGPIAYDTRSLDVDGVPVRDFTVRVFLDPGNATPGRLADIKANTRQGVDAFYNHGNRLPSGEQFHVTVEFTDNPADAHGTVTVTDPDGRANQLNWPVDSDPMTLGHEVGHFLGLHDEYLEQDSPVKPIFQHQDGKGRVVDDIGPMTRQFDTPGATVKPRNLWLIENRMHALESFNPPGIDTAPDTAPAADVQPPNVPFRRTTPNPVVPLATITPHRPARVLADTDLPRFFQDNQALGSIAAVDVKGASRVTGAVNGIAPADAARIDTALTSDFESFLGHGRNFQVQIGGNWFEANVRATMMPPADPGTAGKTPTTSTKVDMTAQSGTSTSTTDTLATANDVGGAVTAGVPVGPYGSLGGKAQLATPATATTSSTSAVDQRAIRSGEFSTLATVPVSYEITLTDARGQVQPSITVDTTDPADPVDVTLQIPDDLSTITGSNPTIAQNPDLPPADWGARIEHPVPEAVAVTDPGKAFTDVAAKLHPSITKIGSPGRTALQTFLSPTTVRDNLGAMLTGWVTSPDLVSPHASKGAAVQVHATLRTAELVGVHDSAQLRLHESTAFGTGVTATTKTGFDVTGGFGGNLGVPGAVAGQVGATLGYSARTAESSNAGTSTTNRTGIQLKGVTGLYKVTADVEVRTPSGGNVTVPITTYVRMGTPEAAALNLPVPEGTRTGIAEPTAEPRWAPPYLNGGIAGNAKVGDFEPASRVQPQVEAALKNVKGLKDFLPSWNDPNANPRSGKGQGFTDVAQQLANQRKLNQLSPTALKSSMDSLLGPGVTVQMKSSDATTDTYVNITVKAKLTNSTHLGQADARNVRGSSSSGPKLDSSTATTKGWSGGVEGKVVLPNKTPVATVTPTPQVGAKYNHSWTTKNTGGPSVNSTSLNVGSPNAQVFANDVAFEVEITTFTRPRSWVQRVTPGKPGRHAPEPRVVARTVGASLDPSARNNPEVLPLIHGKVNLWVSDSSAMKVNPSGFAPGPPVVAELDDAPTIKTLLTTTRPVPTPEFLHVEAVANTTALRDQAIDALNRAANGDSALTVPGTESRNQVDRLFSQENIKANLRKLVETGMQEPSLRYDRRITDRTGSVGMSMKLGNPQLVSISDDTGTENAVTGGYKAGDSKSVSRSADLTAGINVPVKPNVTPGQPSPTSGAGGVAVTGKYTPWADSKSEAREISGSVDRNVVTPPGARTVLVQLDADVTIVGESRAGNVFHGGTPRAEGATVKLPKSVFVRVSEDVARQWKLLPDVTPNVPPAVVPGMVPPRMLADGEPGSLGLSTVDQVPDMSGVVTDLIADVNRKTAKRFGDPLVPDSVLEDSMNNLQRLVDFSSPTSVKAMIDSALDGGVPLVVHQPGTFGKDSFQVTLRAKTGTPQFDRVVNDGVDMEHTIAGAEKVTGGQGRGTGWGVGIKAPGLAQPGSANPNVSGTAGVAVAAGFNHAVSTSTTDATTRQFGHLRAGSGPAVKYAVPVEFELVVEKGSETIARATSGPQEMGVRVLADNQKVAGGAPNPPYMAAAIRRGGELGTPTAARAWQQAGSPTTLPPNASVEGLRGVKDLREAAVQALVAAGANQGVIGKGSGPLTTLLSTVSSENLQPSLPGMLHGPLEVPGLHEAALTFGQHADVKVYAKLVNPRLGALSDGVKLENPRSTVSTTSGEAKVSENADVSVGFATGSVGVKQGTDPKDTVNVLASGIEVRHAAEDSQAVSGGVTDNKVNNLKPQGRSGLVEFDVEYRVVATIGGRTGVVDLAVPGSAVVRMPAPEAEAALGRPLGQALSDAQEQVKVTAKAWRDAEVEVDRARNDAQDTINDVAAQLANLTAEQVAERAAQQERIRVAEVELNDKRRAADVAQQAWWTAKGEVDQQVDIFNTPPPAPTPAPTPPPPPPAATQPAATSQPAATQPAATSQPAAPTPAVQPTTAPPAPTRPPPPPPTQNTPAVPPPLHAPPPPANTNGRQPTDTTAPQATGPNPVTAPPPVPITTTPSTTTAGTSAPANVPVPNVPPPNAPSPNAPIANTPALNTPAPAANVPAANARVHNAAVANVPVPTASVSDVAVPNAPVQNAPILNAPVPNPPAPNFPVPNVPVPTTPAPNAPVPNAPAPNVPVQNTPAHNIPAPNIPPDVPRALVDEAVRSLQHTAHNLLPTAPPPTPDGLYAAVAHAAKIPPAALRHAVVTAATAPGVAEHVANFTAARPMREKHLYGALVENMNWTLTNSPEDARAANARDLAARLIATRLGVNLVIHVPGAPPWQLPPFTAPVTREIHVDVVVVNGVATFRPR